MKAFCGSNWLCFLIIFLALTIETRADARSDIEELWSADPLSKSDNGSAVWQLSHFGDQCGVQIIQTKSTIGVDNIIRFNFADMSLSSAGPARRGYLLTFTCKRPGCIKSAFILDNNKLSPFEPLIQEYTFGTSNSFGASLSDWVRRMAGECGLGVP
jgi:hypothetical protein